METLHEACPFYAADIPYTLGAIAYATGEYDDAMKWFDRFLRWESVSGRPLTPRELKRVPQVEAILPELRFLQQFNAHPDAPQPRVLSEVATRGEYLPTLSADGTLLFFTRAGQRKAKGDLVGRPFEEVHLGSPPWAFATVRSRRGAGVPSTSPTGMAAPPFPMTTGPCIWPSRPPPGNPENIDLYATRYELLDDTGEERVYLWSDPEPLAP